MFRPVTVAYTIWRSIEFYVALLLLHGLQVFTCSRDEGELGEALKEWQERGFSVQGCTCDVSDRKQRDQLVT